MRAPLIRFFLERAVMKHGKLSVLRLTEDGEWVIAPPNPMGFSNLRKATDKAISLGVANVSYIRGRQGGKYKIHLPITAEQKRKRYSSRNTL